MRGETLCPCCDVRLGPESPDTPGIRTCARCRGTSLDSALVVTAPRGETKLETKPQLDSRAVMDEPVRWAIFPVSADIMDRVVLSGAFGFTVDACGGHGWLDRGELDQPEDLVN